MHEHAKNLEFEKVTRRSAMPCFAPRNSCLVCICQGWRHEPGAVRLHGQHLPLPDRRSRAAQTRTEIGLSRRVEIDSAGLESYHLGDAPTAAPSPPPGSAATICQRFAPDRWCARISLILTTSLPLTAACSTNCGGCVRPNTPTDSVFVWIIPGASRGRTSRPLLRPGRRFRTGAGHDRGHGCGLLEHFKA